MTTLYEDKALGFGNEGDLTAQPSSAGIGVSDGGPDPLRAAADEMNGIGMASPAPISRPQSRSDIYAQMSPMQEFGARLGELGAGMAGNPSPMAARMEAARRDKLVQMEELKGAVSALEHGTTLLQGMTGEERVQFSDMYGKQLDNIQPGLGATFKALAEKPGLADQLKKYGTQSPSVSRALQLDPTGKTAFKLLQSPEAQKTIQAEMDASIMPTILRKGQTFITGWQQLVPQEMVDQVNKDGRVTASELIRANEWIKENKPDIAKTLAFNDEELGTIHRNPEAFYHTLGIVSPKDEGQIITARAKGEDRDKAPVTRTIHQGTQEIQQEWKGGKWEEVGRGPRFKPDEGGSANAIPEAYRDLHGADYLAKLQPGEATLVKRIAEGLEDPKSLSTKGGHRERILAMASHYDGTFDSTNYGARNATRKAFAVGTEGKNATSINTSIGHLGTMYDMIDSLANKDLPAWNKVANSLGIQLGKEEATNFSVVQGAVADELMRVFRGVGASQQEADEWRKKFVTSGSPEQLKGAVTTAADLLGSRIGALNDQWKRGMSTDKDYDKLLSPKSRETFAKIGGKLERYGVGGGGPSQPAATNAKGWKLMQDASGNKAYVGPNGEIEEVK